MLWEQTDSHLDAKPRDPDEGGAPSDVPWSKRGGAISHRSTASLMIQRRCLSELRGMKRNLRVALPDLKPLTEAVPAASDNLAVLHADRKSELHAAHCCSDATR